MGVSLLATLIGTAVTLRVLDQLLRPMLATSAALKAFRATRRPPAPRTGFADEVGTLMADAQGAMVDLHAHLTRLEHVDEVTGLPNRSGFLLEGRAGGAVAMVRVMNLDHVDRGLDRETATAMLREVARCLARRLGPDGWLGRVGEADLAVILDADAADDGLGLRERLADLGRPVRLGEVRVTPLLAAGVTALGAGAEGGQALDDAAAVIVTASEAAPVAAHSSAL